MIIGIITYSASVLIPEYVFTQILIIPRSYILDTMVPFMGLATGATAGYATAYLWNKYLKTLALTI
jgi:hypothetical protein